ncbi:MAG: ISL3 family transposase [Gammaproteobacteria bacterium]|nr:ISL3 family transposase [Gammaproteobacteria bacterium]
MSTTLLYQVFGVRGYIHTATKFPKAKTVVFMVRQKHAELKCPACDSYDVCRNGSTTRRWQMPPCAFAHAFIQINVQRIKCRKCGIARQVNVHFAHPRRHHTKQLERYVVALSKLMTIQDVAKHLALRWKTIKEIVKRDLKRKFAAPKLGHLKQIAIDEICIGKGHRYLTIVMDLASGAIVFVGDGKGSDALLPFWKRVKLARASIQAVAIDMSQAYIKAVSENLPKASIVFDRFHIMKLMNEKLSALRRELHNELTDSLRKKALKGTRWLLLKNPDNLDPARNEHERLAEALRLNEPLSTAYYLKDELRLLWQQASRSAAERSLDDWIARAESRGVGMLIKFARTLRSHRWGLLNYYEYPISTGPLEGTNNKIKTMQRQAYGYRDREFFILKIYALHQTKYALVG